MEETRADRSFPGAGANRERQPHNQLRLFVKQYDMEWGVMRAASPMGCYDCVRVAERVELVFSFSF